MKTGPADRERFERVFEATHRRVFAYALRRTAGSADAEDAVADTYAVAWRRIGQLPPDDEALPWLLGVARRVIANQRRGARRWASLLDRLAREPQPRPASGPVTLAAVALSRLEPADQELLRLLAWDGLSQAEAGAVLSTSPNAVAIRLHRARRRFAQTLTMVENEDAARKGTGPRRTSPSVEGSNARPDARGNGR